MSSNHSLDRLTDQALLDQFGDLVQQAHRGTASLLRHIDAIDRRRLWVKYGHGSMFDFCVSRHHMSESTAGKRIGAARTARPFPVLFEMVARGEIHLSGIHCLKAHLTPENHEHVLAQAKHLTIRQIEQLVAHLAPRPDVPSTLRALPERPKVPASPQPAPLQSATTPASAPLAPPTPTLPLLPPARAAAPPQRAPDPEPLAPGRHKLQVTIDETTYQTLKQLQDLLAHQIPNGDPAAIIARALEALFTQVHKQKIGTTDKPRAHGPRTRKLSAAGRSRWIPLALRREVWGRDQGRCSFVGEDGHRCNETRALEFAHVKPWAKGFDHSVDNLCLRCRSHNAWEADRDYGTGFMATKRHPPLKVREPVVRHVPRRAGCTSCAEAISTDHQLSPRSRNRPHTGSAARANAKEPHRPER